MDQSSARELWHKSAINSVKMMTSNIQMKDTFYFRILDIPNKIKIYDVMVSLHRDFKLNFITLIQRCAVNNGMRSVILACRNDREFYAFINKNERITIKGFNMKIEHSNRPLAINLVKVNKELEQDVIDLSRVLSFKAANSYSKAFPSERMLEILLEMKEDDWLYNGIEGIWLKYNHHARELTDKVILMVDSTVSFRQLSLFLGKYGNSMVEKRRCRTLVTHKILWQREEIMEINEHDEAIYLLTRELLSKDMISRE